MTVFNKYAKYYDLLYRDKNYVEDAAFIHRLIGEYAPGAVDVLDLGCGTGSHDILLARMGFSVTGVDQSREMLQIANRHLAEEAAALNVCFRNGDIRTLALNNKFDIVISLFHVMSYQTTDEDLEFAFSTVRRHLNNRGLFIFDCWYGPAVEATPPQRREKRFEDDAVSLVRVASPRMHSARHVVDVDYRLSACDKRSDAVHEILETHSMRYLFAPEVESLIARYGMTTLESREWLSRRTLGPDTWSAYWVARFG